MQTKLKTFITYTTGYILQRMCYESTMNGYKVRVLRQFELSHSLLHLKCIGYFTHIKCNQYLSQRCHFCRLQRCFGGYSQCTSLQFTRAENTGRFETLNPEPERYSSQVALSDTRRGSRNKR